MIEVSAGVIGPEGGDILVCRRAEGQRHAHLWEFPGGKRESGEDAETCLRRELREELELAIGPARVLTELEAEGIRFTFLAAEPLGEPVAREHEAVRFVKPGELLRLPFCPADAPMAAALALRRISPDAFLWDFDGTLADTYPLMTEALCRSVRQAGAALEMTEALDLMKVSLGHALRTLSARFGLPLEALAQAYRAEEKALTPGALPLFPGAGRVLRSLQAAGGRHFLLTHRDLESVRALEAAGLRDCFTGFVTAEDGFPRKPDPTGCRALLERWGINPARAVMIGDRPLDVEAGRAAGTLGCLLDPEHRFDGAEADLRAGSLEELPALLTGAWPGSAPEDSPPHNRLIT